MKRLIASLTFLFLMIAVSGCYTIPQNFADDNECEQIVIYEPICVLPAPPVAPPPPISPIIRPPIVRPPVIVPHPKPIINQPNPPKNSGNSGNQVRDPLRSHGERGNTERNAQGRK